MDKEMVVHPKHYNTEGRKECWAEMEEKYGPDAVIIYDCLCAYKYSYRAGLKDDESKEQDIKKMKFCLNHAGKLLDKDGEHDFARGIYNLVLKDLLLADYISTVRYLSYIME